MMNDQDTSKKALYERALAAQQRVSGSSDVSNGASTPKKDLYARALLAQKRASGEDVPAVREAPVEVTKMGSGTVFSQAGRMNEPRKEQGHGTEFQQDASEMPELIKYKKLGDGLPG